MPHHFSGPKTSTKYLPPAGFVRWRLTVSWDGRGYAGWQIQPNAPGVQEALQVALGRLMKPNLGVQDAFLAVAAGRTDAGVHAEAMPIHWDIAAPGHPEQSGQSGGLSVSPERLPRALNAFLPPDIAVLDAGIAPANFHARFSCTERRYCYRILSAPQRLPLWEGRALHVAGPLDVDAMNAAAALLLGTHDFAAFATQEDRQPVRELRRLEVVPVGQILEIHVHGESFLRHMVRGLVGTLLLVGQGKLSAGQVPDILASRRRSQAGANVAAYGLYFVGAQYPDALNPDALGQLPE